MTYPATRTTETRKHAAARMREQLRALGLLKDESRERVIRAAGDYCEGKRK